MFSMWVKWVDVRVLWRAWHLLYMNTGYTPDRSVLLRFVFSLTGPSGLLVAKVHRSKVERYVSRRVRGAYSARPEELCESKYRRDEYSAALG